MLNLIKRIPHPGYGNYGGYYKRCRNRKQGICPIPIDWLDRAFQQHDEDELTDKELLTVMKSGSPKKLAKRVYGSAYRLGAIAVFSAFTLF